MDPVHVADLLADRLARLSEGAWTEILERRERGTPAFGEPDLDQILAILRIDGLLADSERAMARCFDIVSSTGAAGERRAMASVIAAGGVLAAYAWDRIPDSWCRALYAPLAIAIPPEGIGLGGLVIPSIPEDGPGRLALRMTLLTMPEWNGMERIADLRQVAFGALLDGYRRSAVEMIASDGQALEQLEAARAVVESHLAVDGPSQQLGELLELIGRRLDVGSRLADDAAGHRQALDALDVRLALDGLLAVAAYDVAPPETVAALYIPLADRISLQSLALDDLEEAGGV